MSQFPNSFPFYCHYFFFLIWLSFSFKFPTRVSLILFQTSCQVGTYFHNPRNINLSLASHIIHTCTRPPSLWQNSSWWYTCESADTQTRSLGSPTGPAGQQTLGCWKSSGCSLRRKGRRGSMLKCLNMKNYLYYHFVTPTSKKIIVEGKMVK